MLAGKAPEDLNELRYPLLVSPKLDGIRCIILDGVAMSRKLKPIPNRHVQEVLAGWGREGMDGELMLRNGAGFNAVQSAIMCEDGKPDFVYHVFDLVSDAMGFCARYNSLVESVLLRNTPFIDCVPHCMVHSAAEMREVEERFLAQGFEGAMIRSMHGPYKRGRSTTREGYLLKLKRFEDAEATIISAVELQHNLNPAEKDALGHTKRSTANAGKRGGDTLGKLIVKRADGVEFGIGSGFTAEMRAALWEVRDTLPGLMVKFRFQADPAAPQNAPRFPIYLGMRHALDMD
jgi:DNA ligase-1